MTAVPEMDAEQRLRDKLRKIEALFAGAATAGEKAAAAAGAAAERLRRQFAETGTREPAEEFKFSIPDPWARQLFTALCRRYGLGPFRYRGRLGTSPVAVLDIGGVPSPLSPCGSASLHMRPTLAREESIH